MLPVSRFQNFLCPGLTTMEVAQIGAEDGTFQKFTEVEAIKFSEKNFGGMLKPKSVRRTLVTGLINGPRANKQFDIMF